ncbi:unnamed protein product [Lactuca saligna]|uniref:phosphoenolpyruvate carboxykinase (ATP) n=1 Tax=Lactuca saligna TaxID=75948 RepID=A0AA35ZWB6_LACSI|nr:unnamed protein product [Lactuca saligna]
MVRFLGLVTRFLGLPAHQYQGKSWISYGLNLALARKGVIVNDKIFKNLTISELQTRGATIQDSLSGIPVYIRGNLFVQKSEITKAQFSKLLKQVTTHISSVSDIFVHDGAIGSTSTSTSTSTLQIDAKVRVISDNPTATCAFHNILFQTPTRAVSHDSCPLTVYVASSISLNVLDAIGLGSEVTDGVIAADADLSSLVLCGKAFCDANGIKKALSALSEPIILSRGGLLLHPKILLSCDRVFLIFLSEDTIKKSLKHMVTDHGGVIMSSTHNASPLFPSTNPKNRFLSKFPASMILSSSDSSGVIPTISKLSHGQAAYHFLAGYKNGTFNPAYGMTSYLCDPLQIAKSLFSKLIDNQIPSFLINVNQGEKQISGMDFVNLVESTQHKNIPPFECKGGDLRRRYNNFLSNKFGKLPQHFSF